MTRSPRTFLIRFILVATVLAALVTGVLSTSTWTAGGSSARAAAGDSAELPVFRRGINLSRLQSFAWRDPDRPGKYQWPPFHGDLSKVSDAELDRLRALGFDFVRLPVDAGPFLAATTPERRLLLDDLKTITERLLDKDFSVLVDMHPANYLSVWQPKDILADVPGPKFAAYTALLVDVAKRIRDLPPDRIALELMNEPQSDCYRTIGEDWSVTQKRLFDSVREVAPKLPVVLTPGCWASLDGLGYLDMSVYDAATIVDVHFYEPFYFTHQSLPWVLDPLRYIAGLSYPWTRGTIENAEKLTRQHLSRLADNGAPPPDHAFDKAMDGVRDYYRRKQPDRSFIDRRFDELTRWADEQGIAPDRIVVGEFSAIRPAKGLPDDGSRLDWLRDVREAVEARGFGWSLWDYYEGFGLMTDNKARTVVPGMVEALGLDLNAL
ncbi:MAG: cellulase family glycosylhydrolase [Roseibium sp.]